MAAIIANLDKKEEDRVVDLLHNPNQAPTSSAERRNESRPDSYLALKTRHKEPSKENKIFWADIAVSREYNLKETNATLHDERIHRSF